MYYCYYIATETISEPGLVLFDRGDLLEIEESEGTCVYNRYAYYPNSRSFIFTTLGTSSVDVLKNYVANNRDCLILINKSRTRDSHWENFEKRLS